MMISMRRKKETLKNLIGHYYSFALSLAEPYIMKQASKVSYTTNPGSPVMTIVITSIVHHAYKQMSEALERRRVLYKVVGPLVCLQTATKHLRLGLKMTYSALCFNATHAVSAVPWTRPFAPAPANVLYLILAPRPSLFYIKMSHKWKLSSGNFFNLCAQIKVIH